MNGYKFRRQYSIGKFVIDFYCPKARLAIEIDGDSHFESSEAIKLDRGREELLNKRRIAILRFLNTDVYKNMDGVLSTIILHLPQPLLSKEGSQKDPQQQEGVKQIRNSRNLH